MTLIIAGLLVLSSMGLFHAWIGYPLMLRIRARRWSLITMARDHTESVSIVIPAFNKEAVILRKLRNTLTLDYPRELMEVLVVADGCTDRTEELVRGVRDPRVRLVSLPRGGKLAALQQAVLRARGEVLVFTEANVRLEKKALRNLVRNFADWHVGGVCGTVRMRRRRTGDSLGLGESLFARYDTRVRHLESELGSVHSADSSLYAIRRNLFQAPRNLGQADDLAISSQVVFSGKRLIHEPRAICRRDTPADGAREMRRRLHQANYTMRSILELKWGLLRQRSYAKQLLAHTLARYLTPVWLMTLLATTYLLAPYSRILELALWAQLTLAAVASLGWVLRSKRAGRLPLLALPAWFAGLNIAYFFGLYCTLTGRRPVGATPRKYGRDESAARSATADTADRTGLAAPAPAESRSETAHTSPSKELLQALT